MKFCKRFFGLSGMCLASMLAPSSSLADVINLPVAAETFINAGLPDNNAGTNAWFDAGTDGVGGVRRGLLRFDLSGIPAGSTITSAVVQLTVIKVPGVSAVDSTFGFFRLEASWNEGNKGGNNGALATAGEATWKTRMFGTANWTTAGAADDAAATASAMTAVGATFNATYSWGSAALIGDVQFWLDNPSMNFGWLLRSDAEASSRSVRGFATRENGASAGVLQVGFIAPQRLNVRKVEPGLITINWGGPGTLEEASSVTGSFSDVTGATAPFTTTPSALMAFFRLRMEAQGYSPNAVAYVNLSLQPGLNLIQNPLDATEAGGNSVSNLLAGVPDGTTVYKWILGTGFTVNDYTTLFGWTDPQMTLVPGEGAVLYLPGSSVFTQLFLGEVMQGALSTALVQGFNLVGSRVPQAGRLTADLDFRAVDGDFVYQWDPGYNAPNVFEFGEWGGGDPNIAVAAGIWVNTAAAGSWTRTFSINP